MVVVTSVVTDEVLAFRVVVSICVVTKVDITVSVVGCRMIAVVVLGFVRNSVKDSVVDAVIVRF